MYIKFAERRISQHLATLTSSETAFEVEKAQDKTLEDVEAMDDMRMSIKNPSVRKASAPALLSSGSHMLHTAKGERRFRDKVEREGIDNLPEEEQGKLKKEYIRRLCNVLVVYQILPACSFLYKHFLFSAAIAEALDENLSPAEKRSMEAERRAAWRKARLKSLENVSYQILRNIFAKSTRR